MTDAASPAGVLTPDQSEQDAPGAGLGGEPVVSVEDLVVRINDLTALDGISFSVGPSEAFGLLGPNGAGKTTTMKVLATLLAPTSGSAHVAGFDVRRSSFQVRSSIGFVPQVSSIDGALTVRENLEFYAGATDVPAAMRQGRIDEAAETMELGHAIDRLAKTLSGGTARRLEIATALLSRPTVLLLDEPTAGLDPRARWKVWQRLKVLREQAATAIVVTTHIIREAERHCDQLAILDGGKLLLQDSPRGLRARLQVESLEDAFTDLNERPSPLGRIEPLERSRLDTAGLPPAQDASPAEKDQTIGRLVQGVRTIARAERRKLGRNLLVLLPRSFQPVLWLLVFGTVFSSVDVLPAGSVSYPAFLAPGILAQTALFIAIVSGLGVIWERDVGQLERLLSTSLPRAAIVLGKAAGACMQALAQALVLLIVLAVAAIPVHWSPLRVVATLVVLLIGTAAFACLSMLLAAINRDRERFLGTAQMVTLPLFFASSALYPLSLMPGWLHAAARLNPLTYEIEAMRQLLIGVGAGALWLDFAIVFAFFGATLVATTWIYPKAIR